MTALTLNTSLAPHALVTLLTSFGTSRSQFSRLFIRLIKAHGSERAWVHDWAFACVLGWAVVADLCPAEAETGVANLPAEEARHFQVESVDESPETRDDAVRQKADEEEEGYSEEPGDLGQRANSVVLVADQIWNLTFCVFAVDLDQTSNEEILLFGRGSLPVVGFRDGDNEAYVTGPLIMILLRRRSIGVRVSERLDGRQILEIPGAEVGGGGVEG
ncbi:hypothetical protein KCV06_g172, partial [Aureobasidium melanogenum]